MGRAAFYNPDQVTVYIGGALLGGFASGDEVISVEPMSQAFEDEVGIDGEVARSRVSDRRLKITVRLLQTSKSNAVLSSMLESDRNSANGEGVGAALVQDNSGGSIVNGAQSWIVGHPKQVYGRTAKELEWEFRVADGDQKEGGN